MIELTPRLGGDRPWFQMTCGFGADDPLCDKPATWHVVWDSDALDHSLACDEHMAYAQQFAYYDRHPITETCNVPSAEFVWSWEEPPGRCVWIVSDETMAAVEAAEREPAHA